jgi:hypothetical protein
MGNGNGDAGSVSSGDGAHFDGEAPDAMNDAEQDGIESQAPTEATFAALEGGSDATVE